MGRLVYTGIGSLDGFIADENGDFEWAAPSTEVHAFINRRDQAVALELYGRRLYEVMKVWETFGTEPGAHHVERDYGEAWRGRDKIVYSTTLPEVATARTTLERSFDPVAVRALVDRTDGDVTIGGPDLASHALRAGIVDRVEYYVVPVVIGNGTRLLPPDLRLQLELVDEHRFQSGVVFLSYETS